MTQQDHFGRIWAKMHRRAAASKLCGFLKQIALWGAIALIVMGWIAAFIKAAEMGLHGMPL